MRPRSALLLASLAAALSVPASAVGATVSLVPVPSRSYGMEPTDPNLLSFMAKPGERNHVTGSVADGAWRFRDTTAPVTPGAGCRRVDDHEAACPRPAGGPVFGPRLPPPPRGPGDGLPAPHPLGEAERGNRRRRRPGARRDPRPGR